MKCLLPLFASALLLSGCALHPVSAPGPQRLPRASALVRAGPSQVGMDPRLPARLDSILRVALAQGAAPGASLAVGRYGRLVYHRAWGRMDAPPGSARVDTSAIWDLASVSKVVGTTTAAMILEDGGRLDLDRTVASYVPGFNAPDKAAITVRMILEHRGGLEAFARLFLQYRGPDQYLQQINARPLAYLPGTRTVYSDWDMILLQRVVEAISREPLDRFLQRRVFGPLGMRDTEYNPPATLRRRVVPTQFDSTRGGLIRGQVHDPNAWAIGGVAGHAGLFSTTHDLAIFAQMLLNGGDYGGIRIVRPETLARWTAPQNAGSSRALGWDTPSGESSAGGFFGPRSFGHTGYTGTSLWMDPERGVFVVLLTNRVNPTDANQRHVQLRRDVADAVQAAILDAPLVNWGGGRR